MFERVVEFICSKSVQKPFLWIVAALVLSLPFVFQIPTISLDTDPVRLLPNNSLSARLMRELAPIVGERSFFYVLFKGDDRSVLVDAVEETAALVADVEGIKSVEFRYPVDFFEKYRYLLIPSEFLYKIEDSFLRWESEVNPLSTDLMLEEENEETYGEIENRRYISLLMERYGSLPDYHQSKEGRVMGMIVFPFKGLTGIDEAKQLYGKLKAILEDISQRYGVWSNLGGALSRWVTGYNVILSDIARSGMVLVLGIVFVLFIGFRSLRIIPVLFFPLCIGLIWALGSIPFLVGDLNTITSFFLVVSFGLGIDFSIHLTKRFQEEFKTRSLTEALKKTFTTTGKAVSISGLTTAAAFFSLALSDFRGISEFGIVGGAALLEILLAMFLFLPATLALGVRHGLVRRASSLKEKKFVLSQRATCFVLVVVVGASVFGCFGLRFDYDFTKLGPTINEPKEVKESQNQIYVTSIAPQALYVCEDLVALDEMLDLLKKRKSKDPDSTIGWVRSVRDFSPDEKETELRLEIIEDIKTHTRGRWVRRLDDPEKKKWIEDLNSWRLPFRQPEIEELPEVLKQGLLTDEVPGKYVISVYSSIEPRDGRNAQLFTQELYGLENI
jgi:predicted RND superfamily exporter protein